MNADGTGRTRLTEDRQADYNPEFSPDGSRIAFVSDRGRSRDVWAMNADGTDQRQYGATRGSGASDIYVMNADGTNQTNVTRTPGQFESEPDWTASGRRGARPRRRLVRRPRHRPRRVLARAAVAATRERSCPSTAPRSACSCAATAACGSPFAQRREAAGPSPSPV